MPWTRWSWRLANGSVGLTFLLLASCTDSSPPPFELLRVEPSTVRASVATPAVVKGTRFYNFANVRLNDNEPSTIDRGWDVRVDDVHLRRDQTSRTDETSLAIVLPAGLPIGIHDLSVTDPRGQSQTLSDALTVVADNNTTVPNATGGATSIGSGGTTSRSDGGSSGNTLLPSGGTEAAGGTTSSSMGGTEATGGTTSSSMGGTEATGGTASSSIGGTQATGGNSGTGQTSAPAATCNDGVLNGSETALDCGGSDCPACPCQQADFTSLSEISLDRADIPTNAPLWSPTLSADGLTMYFAATIGTGERIYQTTRTSTTSFAFTNTKAVFPGVTDSRGTPALSFDGLTLYFHSTGLGGPGNRDIYAVTRQTVNSSFGVPQPISEVNTPALEHLPFVTRDELTLYYLSEASGNADIWRAQRSSRHNAFGAGSPVAELNGTSSEARITLTSDGRVAYFSSNRDAPSNYDVSVAIRASNGVFSAPARVPTLNSATKEMDLAMSRDNTEMFFVSYRRADGTSAIYRALRQCK